MSASSEVRLDRLLGREVLAGNNQPVGLLEEFRAEMRGTDCVITSYVIGPAGFIERMGLQARALVKPSRRGYIARWDQLDISDESKPRLTVPVSELEELS